ncbi:hypothetical protein OV450_6059 [Actinobacteria bacterium OV450]|nr:hypothetical protein OV450_6059 [Actinobacteria bacterium OV450]
MIPRTDALVTVVSSQYDHHTPPVRAQPGPVCGYSTASESSISARVLQLSAGISRRSRG